MEIQPNQSKEKGSFLLKIIDFVASWPPMIISIFWMIIFMIVVVSIMYSHKIHNPVEEVAAQLIKAETGIDIDQILPADED